LLHGQDLSIDNSGFELQSEALAAVDEDIHRLDVGLRQLKVQYDMFIAGSLKRQPLEQRSQLERIVKKYSDKPMRNYAQRFRFAALVSRFNCFSERWGKTIRSMEEGDHRNPAMLDRYNIRERMLARASLGGGGESDRDLRRLHGLYAVEARRLGGKPPPPFEVFLRGVRVKTQKLRDRSGCAEIELRVIVRDEKIQLKARPRR